MVEPFPGGYIIPRTPMTSILEGQPLKTVAFSSQNNGHLGSRI